MKLQKRFNRKVAGKEYSKWVVNLPPEDIERLGWNEGMELEPEIKNGKLIIKRKTTV